MHGGCGAGLASRRRREVISHYPDCDKVRRLGRQVKVMHSGLSNKGCCRRCTHALCCWNPFAAVCYGGEILLQAAAINFSSPSFWRLSSHLKIRAHEEVETFYSLWNLIYIQVWMCSYVKTNNPHSMFKKYSLLRFFIGVLGITISASFQQ